MKTHGHRPHSMPPSPRGRPGARAWAALGSLLLAVLPMTSHATEEPDYTVIQKFEDMEVREYAAYTVAENAAGGTVNVTVV